MRPPPPTLLPVNQRSRRWTPPREGAEKSGRGRGGRRSGAREAAVVRRAQAVGAPKPPKVTMPTAALPLPDPEPTTKAPAERRKGDYALPPAALLDAPKTIRKMTSAN